MNTLKRKLILGIGIVTLSQPVYAEDTDEQDQPERRIPVAEPAEVCFFQTVKIGDLDSMTLQHFLTVPSEHHGKHGMVFVGARFKSQPDITLLTFGGDVWRDARGDDDYPGPLPYSNELILKPLVPITIFNRPINLEPYKEEGEIWVGYGLFEPRGIEEFNEDRQLAYDEMIASDRFLKIWTAGEWPDYFLNNSVQICAIVNEVIERRPIMGGRNFPCTEDCEDNIRIGRILSEEDAPAATE